MDVAHPDVPDRAQRLERLRVHVQDPEWRAARIVGVRDGRVHALTWLFDTGPGSVGLGAPRTVGGAPLSDDDTLVIDEALTAARGAGAIRAGMRLPVARWTEAVARMLARTGGEEIGGRVEFRTPLDVLPGELAPARLRWRPATLDEAAHLLARCSAGSDDGLEPGEDPHDVVQSWLADPELGGEPAASLHAGALDGEDIALVCAQVGDDGWSTLTFMGLAPGARGRGLGHEVHRHGLAMLRAQGGQLYHGGTSLDNGPMRACFARQGCREWQRFRQLRWELAAPL